MSLYDELKNKYGDINIEFTDYYEKKLLEKVRAFQKRVEEENKTIKDINEQIIITNPYFYHEIVGKVHHYACCISGGKVKDNEGIMAVFTSWDESILNR